MRNILKVELLCVIHFYYYFHMHKPWEFYYPFNFHKSLRITEKLLLRSDYIFHSFIKIYFVEMFFSVFPFLLPYECFVCMAFITITWQLIKVNRAREERRRKHEFFLSNWLTFPMWIWANHLTSPWLFPHLYSRSKFPMGFIKIN